MEENKTKEPFKSGFVSLVGRPNVGELYVDEPHYRTEDRDYEQ